MSSPSDKSPESIPESPWLQAALEVAIIALLCFVMSGGPPPGINEAHYLAKAKHYWDPSWCAGDFFLDSADAHLAFYWTFGWVTRFFSLPATAWIGRFVVWALMAAGWQRLSWAVAPRPWLSVVSALLFFVLMQWLPMAGEWVVGGVEAKGFAFAFLFVGLEAVVRGNWRTAWLWLGAASAFHVLVGGWGVIAAGIAWIITTEDRWQSFVTMLPGLIGGLLLALPGLIPALQLTWGVPREIVDQANDLYVHQRLLHHLRLAGFPHDRVLWFTGGAIAWAAAAILLPAGIGELRLRAWVLGAISIALVGLTLDLAFTYFDATATAAAVMRYYWYRLADFAVPLGLALGLVGVVQAWTLAELPERAHGLLAAGLCVGMAGCGWTYYQQSQQSLPEADAQGGVASLEDWRRVCAWIRDTTPPNARVLSPSYHNTFKWYAERSEVISFKDQPQDAYGIVEWWDREWNLYAERGPDGNYCWRESASDISTDELVRASRDLKYDFQYVIVETRHHKPNFKLRRVYPTRFEPNETFEVYEMPR